MGCDIHSAAIDADGNDITSQGKWSDGKTANPDCEYTVGEGEPFVWRSYAVFGFLAGVRNYSEVTPIAEPRGLPDGLKFDTDDDNYLGEHSFSWLSIAELSAFDYDAEMEDRRTTGVIKDGPAAGIVSGAITAPIGEGERMTYRQFLHTGFFHDLAELQRIGADRVVFGFDS